MNQQPSPVAPRNPDRRFEGPLQPWEFAFLLLFAASLLVAAVWESNNRYLDNDELCTSLLVSNPNLSEMLNVIRVGGELNPPLFFVVEWCVARVFGAGELAMRTVSAVSGLLAGWLLFFALRPLTGPRIAAVSMAMVLGLSREAFHYYNGARYYSMFFMLVCLAVFLTLRFNEERPLQRRHYLALFLSHWAMIYVHLFGLLYSGVLLVAMVTMDAMRSRLRWRLYGCVLAAWATFGAWFPFTVQQVKSAGSYTPPGYHTIGYIIEWFGLQVPVGLVFLCVALLGGLALVLSRPCPATDEANACAAPMDWSALVLVSIGLMAVLIGSWFGSFVITALFMPRYVFPSTAAWVLVVGLVLMALCRLPPITPALRFGLPPRLWTVTWFGILAFCLLFQPMRARKNPRRAAAPFVDPDFGYKDLPVVFENSWPYMQRAVYGRGRPYLMLIDREAGEADPFWYTKLMEHYFRHYYPRYDRIHVAHYQDLPDTFLAIDDDFTKTFDYLWAYHPEWQTRLLGKKMSEPEIFGEQRTYLVQKTSATNSAAVSQPSKP